MAFSSLLFLFFFLPAFFLVYCIIPAPPHLKYSPNLFRNSWALFASFIFYAWGAPHFFPILIATSLLDHLAAQAISKLPDGSERRRLLLFSSISLNISIFFYFKYANFFVAQLNSFLAQFNHAPMVWTEVILPIGISFITFEKISYLVDVSRKRVLPAESLLTYWLFLALFPHLIAGPIFRYHDVADQLLQRQHNRARMFSGICRLTLGLAKKTLIADPLSLVVDKLFSLPFQSLPSHYAWIGAFCYSLQIYYDFSGYSDMAIGLGRMMGFEFLENFNRPYLSQNVTEFWRRWHISLSNWMKEYLYIPLGGNRHGTARMYLNLWIVFLLSGFWHGASWNFVVWGVYHGSFLVLDRLFLLAALERCPSFIRVISTFLVVTIGWVPFRSPTLSEAAQYLSRMFLITDLSSAEAPDFLLFADVMNNRCQIVFVLAFAFTFLPLTQIWSRCEKIFLSEKYPFWTTAACGFASLIFLLLSTLSLVNSQFHPFIYFRF